MIENWLEAQDLTDLGGGEFDEEAIDALYAISRLAVADAPTHDLADAVRQARAAGWDWTPIAMLLGMPVAEAHRQFAPPTIPRPRHP